MREGYAEYLAIRERLNLPLLETGAAVVAWSEADLARLDEIETRARQNDVVDIRRVSRAELLEREPHLAPTCLGGLLVPGEPVIEPWSAPLAYLRQAVANGAEARFDAEVQGGEFARGRWTLQTTAGPVEAALTGPLPARDFGGLKRRTRAGMGRCQGFYCGAELAALTAGRFAAPLAVGTVRG
jgi:glycerol-3-phosphate dehydrogenase